MLRTNTEALGQLFFGKPCPEPCIAMTSDFKRKRRPNYSISYQPSDCLQGIQLPRQSLPFGCRGSDKQLQPVISLQGDKWSAKQKKNKRKEWQTDKQAYRHTQPNWKTKRREWPAELQIDDLGSFELVRAGGVWCGGNWPNCQGHRQHQNPHLEDQSYLSLTPGVQSNGGVQSKSGITRSPTEYELHHQLSWLRVSLKCSKSNLLIVNKTTTTRTRILC